MTKVYITDYIKVPDIEKKILNGNVSNDDKEDAEVLLVWHKIVDKEYLDQFPQLKTLIRYGVGCDNIDADEVRKRKLTLCNTPDYGIDEVSDTTIALLLSLTRGIVRYNNDSRYFLNNSWQENTYKELRRSRDMTVGVIGAGRIGGSVIIKLKALGFKVVFYDPFVGRGYEKTLGVDRYDDLVSFLGKVDIVSINASLTDSSYEMVDDSFIKKMKDKSYLINTARGKIIKDIDIFIKPIEDGKILGVGLDVLPVEPPLNSGIINSWKKNEKWLSDRLIINPHAGYYSQESWVEMRIKAAENAQRVLEKKEPFNILIKN